MNKRNLHLGIFLALFFMGLSVSIQAQDGYLFFEDFTGSSAVDNPEYSFPSAWQVYDEDGLTSHPDFGVPVVGWETENFGDLASSPIVYSISWYDPAGQADDWLVTPAVTVESSGYLLQWKTGTVPGAQDGSTIYVSTSGNSVQDFLDGDVVYEVGSEEALNFSSGPATLYQREISLDDYEGETIHIAFRNNTNNGYLLIVDDIAVLPPPDGIDAQLRSPEIPMTYGWMPVFQATPIGPFGANVLGFNAADAELENTFVTAYIDSVDVDGNFFTVWSAESEAVASIGQFEEVFFEIDEIWFPTVPGTYALRYELEHDGMDDDNNAENNFSQNYFFQITNLDYSRNAQFLGGDPPLISEFESFFYPHDDTDADGVVTDVSSTGAYGQVLEFVGYSSIDSIGMIIQNATGTITIDIYEFDPVTNTIGDVLGSTVPFTDGTSGGEYILVQMEQPLSLAPGHYFMAINDPADGSANVIEVSHYWTENCCWVQENGGAWEQRTLVPVLEAYLTELEGAATTVNYNINQDAGFSYDFQGIANGFVESWLWDFGDGTTSTDQNATHTYTEAGEYEVTLTITVEGEEITSDTFTITIECSLTAEVTEVNPTNATITAEEGSTPYAFVLLDADGNEIDSNETGIFGENDPLTLETAYSVNVTDADGCTTETLNFTTSGCIFEVNPPNVADQTVSFFDSQVTGTPSIYNWPPEFNAGTGTPLVSGAPVGDWTMVIEDEFGCSQTVVFSVWATGIEDISVLNDLQIAPNPVRDAFTLDIDLKEATDLNYGIYDISGKLMKEVKAGIVTAYSETIDVSELPVGIYVLKINLNDAALTYRLVLSK